MLKSYHEHSEPLFTILNILNTEKINDFLTSLFMFRYHFMNNLPKYFTNSYVNLVPRAFEERCEGQLRPW